MIPRRSSSGKVNGELGCTGANGPHDNNNFFFFKSLLLFFCGDVDGDGDSVRQQTVVMKEESMWGQNRN